MLYFVNATRKPTPLSDSGLRRWLGHFVGKLVGLERKSAWQKQCKVSVIIKLAWALVSAGFLQRRT